MADALYPPPPSENWVAANQPVKAGIRSSHTRFKRDLMRLRDALVGDIVALGLAEEEANSIVEHNLIGVKKPARGRPGYYASPDAVSILRQQEGETSPEAPPSWASRTKLYKEYYIGDTSQYNKLIGRFSESLIRDITAAGISEEDATAIVEQNFVGSRKPNKGPPSTHVSPDAIAIMEAEGTIRRR